MSSTTLHTAQVAAITGSAFLAGTIHLFSFSF